MPGSGDTIYALSSGRPPAAIAVVRMSGPRAGDALKALTGRLPEPRKAALVRVRDPASGEPIDDALALWCPGPNSETGEDTAELQLHGGRAVIAAALDALGRIAGLRLAGPGEFTRRAFENGKLDLTAVEGLADLIGAETEAQRRQAYRQLKGLLGDRAERWRKRLIEALALVEARIDFSDEADVPEDLIGPALAIARELRDEIAAVLADGRRGERLREGLVVAIAGPPNAGKSTLLNRIARRDAAIVSPVPGTTRDAIEVHLDLGGYPVTLVDTAGIRNTVDPVEREGVRRARERARDANIVFWVVDACSEDGSKPSGTGAEGGGPPRSVLTDGVQSVDSTPGGGRDLPGNPPTWRIGNKTDLLSVSKRNELRNNTNPSNIVFYLSADTGEGVDPLIDALKSHISTQFDGESAFVTRERHRTELRDANAALDRALSHPESAEDILAEDLRGAAVALGRLTGRIDVEDLLTAIFRDFCIGK